MIRTLIATIALAAASFHAPALAADAHSHGAAEPHQLTLDHGKKWATDAPLREGMNDIRAALAARSTGIHRDKLSPEEYATLGGLVESRVGRIVAECKLEPAADANLHVVVAQLVAAADAMKDGAGAARRNGALQAIRAVNEYGRYFTHPGWKPLA